MDYQPENQPGYDAYGTAYEQSNYSAYSTADQSTAGSQSQLSTASAAPTAASSKCNCTTVAISFVVLTFLIVGIVFVATRDVQQNTYGDDEEDLGGSGGSGGGGGSRGGGGPPPIPPIPVVRMGNMTGMPIIEVITNPRQLSTAATTQLPSASPSPPPVVTRVSRSTRTTVTVPLPPGPVIVAEPMPSSPYICTVSEPVRSNLGYLPPDGFCDYLFFDSLYKTFKSRFIHGVKMMEAGAQYFVSQATRYSKTKFGLSFSPENSLYTDYKERAFFNTLDEVWSQRVSHFGFLDLYMELTRPDIFLEALEVLKELYKHLEPNFSAKRPSYYVVAMAPDSKGNDQIINFIQKVFTPSMFIAVAHISYPLRLIGGCLIFPVAMETLPEFVREMHDYYGHSVNESLALLHEVDKTGLSIPLGISLSLKGVYYAPMFADPSAPKADEFQLFKPCRGHREPFYEDPKVLCTKSGWISNGSLPVLAYNMGEKKTITYLTEATIAQLACNAKQLNLNLKFTLAAYDVDFDQAPPCHRLGFAPSGGPFIRIKNMREVMNFILTSYTSTKENFNCQLVAISIG